MKTSLTFTILATGLILPLLNSCGSAVGLGSGTAGSYASTTIKSANMPLIRSTTSAVFQESGFSPSGSTPSSLSFRKMGSPSAQLAWGNNLNSNPVMIEPQVQISPRGQETLVVCDVYMVQQSNVYGENAKKPHLVGKAGYQGMLSKIRKRVEKAERAMMSQ